MKLCKCAPLIASVMFTVAASFPAAAETAAEFYKGKTVTLVVGHEPGSGFDVYARVLARHIGRHIPGQPNIVVQNMIGASGMISANWLYNVAPKDGTVVANFSGTVPTDPVLGSTAARFEPAKFAWIGNMDESAGTCGISKASGITNFDELRAKDSVFGGTGATGPFAKFAYAVRNLFNTKMKVVPGYKGSASVKIAIMRGELDGICGLPVSTITSYWREEFESGAFKPIIQLNGKKHPRIKGVPHVDDYATSEEDRQVYELIFGVQTLGRVYSAPPGTPVERRDALRMAFMATMNDQQFLTDAAKTKIDIDAMSGVEVEEFIARLAGSPPAVVKRAKEALRTD
jgi:tripartite-type tricarboxylate transporter receptor subunit TctC